MVLLPLSAVRHLFLRRWQRYGRDGKRNCNRNDSSTRNFLRPQTRKANDTGNVPEPFRFQAKQHWFKYRCRRIQHRRYTQGYRQHRFRVYGNRPAKVPRASCGCNFKHYTQRNNLWFKHKEQDCQQYPHRNAGMVHERTCRLPFA